MTFPPLCDRCDWQHIGHCDDAAEYRNLVALICTRFDELMHPVTAMADVPPALRGPNWPGPTA